MRIKTTQYSNVLVLAFLAIVAMAGIVVLERFPAAEQSNTQVRQITWEKYEKDGVSFEYPSSMHVLDNPLYNAAFTIMFNTTNIDIVEDMRPRIQIYKADEPIEAVVSSLNESRNKDQFPELSEIEIGGKKAYQTKALDPEVIFTHTVIGDEKTTYLFEMFSSEVENKELEEAYARVIETFSF